MKNRAKNKKTGNKKMPSSSAAPAGELRRDAEELALLEGRWKILGDAKPPKIRPRNTSTSTSSSACSSNS